MVNISEDNITITMTYEQQDVIMVQACKHIYRDAQDQIAQLESTSDLKEYQMDDLIYHQELKSACEVLLKYHLTERAYKIEMENE
jgi:hypothetical protein